MEEGKSVQPAKHDWCGLTGEIDPALYDQRMSEEEFLKRNQHIDLGILQQTNTGMGGHISLSSVLAYVGCFREDNLYFVDAVRDGILDVGGRFTQAGFDRLVLQLNDQRRSFNELEEERIAERKKALEPFNLDKIKAEVARLLDKYFNNARFGLTVEYEGRGEEKHPILMLTFGTNLRSDSFRTKVVRGGSKKELLMKLADELGD